MPDALRLDSASFAPPEQRSDPDDYARCELCGEWAVDLNVMRGACLCDRCATCVCPFCGTFGNPDRACVACFPEEAADVR